MEFKISHIDVHGKCIPDISKVFLPADVSLVIYQIISDHRREVRAC